MKKKYKTLKPNIRRCMFESQGKDFFCLEQIIIVMSMHGPHCKSLEGDSLLHAFDFRIIFAISCVLYTTRSYRYMFH